MFGFVVGLAAEARIAARFGCPVRVGGGTPEGAAEAANRLVGQEVDALVSFGFAGGLDPALRAGAVIVPRAVLFDGTEYAVDCGLAERFGGITGHLLVAGSAIAADAAAKRRLRAETQADAIDLESGGVARVAKAFGLPFVAVRAISDAAATSLPPAALLPLDGQGRVDLAGVLGSVVRQPWQLPALLRLAFHAGRARQALVRVARLPRVAGRSGSRG